MEAVKIIQKTLRTSLEKRYKRNMCQTSGKAFISLDPLDSSSVEA
jgi:hypothetical protein